MAEELSDLIDTVVDASKAEEEVSLSRLFSNQNTDEIALVLESLPREQRHEAWQYVPADEQLAVLVAMRADPREGILDLLSQDELDALFVDIAAEDLIELSELLPTRMIDRALRAMDEKQRGFFENAQAYADELIGHWVDHGLLILPLNAKVRDGMRLLRREMPAYTDSIYLVNRTGQLSERVAINRLLTAPDHLPLVDVADDELLFLNANEDAVDAAKRVQNVGMTALPVIDDDLKLLGRVNIGEACLIVNEWSERQLMVSAGLNEDEDLFSPVRRSAQNRAVWLGINLITAFLASWFIGLFEATLQQVVALAVLMPIVASMGGIAGSQTLTLMIRGLALGQVTGANLWALLKKELSVGGLNGLIWAVVIGIAASFWFQQLGIGIVIALAILVNIIAAALSGVLIPMALEKLKLDPALSGSVILTTVTDIVGFVAFLGLGTWVLL